MLRENDSGKKHHLRGPINGSDLVKLTVAVSQIGLIWIGLMLKSGTKIWESIEAGNMPDLPTIEIEVYFASPDEDEIAIKKYRGNVNIHYEDAEGVKLEIIFDTQYAPAYKQLLVEGKVRDIPVEYYRVNFRSLQIQNTMSRQRQEKWHVLILQRKTMVQAESALFLPA